MNPTIEEIKKAKSELEAIVKAAVMNFEERTGIIPGVDVEITRAQTVCGAIQSWDVKTTVVI